MNWLILIIAGCMEVAFTFCLGKTKTAAGIELFWWWGGFVVALTLSMVLMAKAAFFITTLILSIIGLKVI